MGHRRYVHGGTVCASAAGGSCRGQEPASGGPGVWAGAEDDRQDAGVFLAARLPAAEAGPAAQAGTVAGRDRRHSGRGQAAAEEAAAHGQADLRAAASRVPVHGRLHDREGLRAGRQDRRPGDVRAAEPRSGRSAGGLRRSGGGDCRRGVQGAFHGLRSASLRRLLRTGLSCGDDRSLPRGSRARLRVLRRRSHTHPVRQHDAGGGAHPGQRGTAEDTRLFRVTELLPVRGEVRPPGQGQR